MPFFLAHTFPLPVLVVMYAITIGTGYGLPIAALILARKGGRFGAAILAIIPLVFFSISSTQVYADQTGSLSLRNAGWIIVVIIVPLILSLASLTFVARNFLRHRTKP